MSTDKDVNSPRLVGEVMAFATVLVAILGMFLSSPRFAGPDENAHQATAWYVSVNGFPPRSESVADVPSVIPSQVCFAFTPEADTGCIGPRIGGTTNSVRVFNYPPVYYWAVAVGQRMSAEISDIWIDVGGRLASILLNVSVLLVLAMLVRRVSQSWGTYILLIATPMVVFLWAVVNPSGWEISSGLLFAFLLARIWWSASKVGVGSGPSRVQFLILAFVSVLFALSRHDAILWMTLLTLCVPMMGKTTLNASERVRALLAVGLGLLAGLLWNISFPAQHPLANAFPVDQPGFSDYVGWLSQIDNVLADRIRQMVGVLGWLDTPVPQWLMFLVLASWAALIGVMYARASIPPIVLCAGFVVAIGVPSIIEVIRWNDWPYWYQGRITLPFAVAFLLLMLIRFGRTSRLPAVAVSLVSAFSLAFMVWQNLIRNAFGVRAYLPKRWSGPVLEEPLYWGSLACIAVIVLLTAARVVLLGAEIHRARVSQHTREPTESDPKISTFKK